MSETLGEGNTTSKKNNHIGGLFAGIGVGLVSGGILAAIAIGLEQEISILNYAAIALVGYVVSRFVPNKSAMGATTGALACGLAYALYALILIMFGYWYTDGDSTFWITLVIAAIWGGSMGYKGKQGFEGEK